MNRVSALLILFWALHLSGETKAQNTGPATEYAQETKDTAYIEQLIRHSKRLENVSTDKAVTNYREAFYYSSQSKYPEGAAISLLRLSVCFKKKGDNKSALEVTREALPYIEASGTSREKLMCMYYMRMGGCFRVLNEKDSAIIYNFRALDQAVRLRDINTVSEIYSNISLLYLQSEYYDKALQYLQSAVAIADLSDFDQKTVYYIHMAEAYKGKQNMDQFYHYTRKAQESLVGKEIVTEGKYSPLQSILFNFCEYFSLNQQADSLIYYAGLSLNSVDKDNPFIHLTSYRYLAEGYYKLRDLSKAKTYVDIAIGISDRTDEYTDNEVYRIASDIYRDLGSYKSALNFQSIYMQLNAEAMDVQKTRAFNEIEGKYRTAEKDKQIARNQLLLTQTTSRLHEKNLWLGASAISSALLILVMMALFRNYTQQQRLQAERIQTMQQEREIGNLKAMIKGEEKERSRLARELHDGVVSQLVSTKLQLDHLRKRRDGLIMPSEIDEAYTELEEAARELRKTAHNMLPDILIQSGLETAVGLFCEKTRKAAQLDLRFEAIGNVPRLHSDVELDIYRMIQELVQNILKHASASHVLIQLVFRDDLLSITAEDNGVGCSPDKLKSDEGGLSSIRTRVQAMAGHLEISSSGPGKGTTVYMEFDIFSLLKGRVYGHQGSYNG